MNGADSSICRVTILPILLTACTTLEESPPPSRASVDAAVSRVLLADTAEQVAAIESARAAIADYEGAAGRSTHLTSALALLDAARRRDRAQRIEILESAREDADDEVAKRLIEGALERDVVWLAEELDSDSVYSDFASFLNGVTQTFAAAIQGNPIATLQPLVVGIEGVLHGLPLDARDRARLALERRLRLEGIDSSSADSIERRVAKLRDQTGREELWLARAALRRGAYSTALAHIAVAASLAVHGEEVTALREEITSAARESARRLHAALDVASDPSPWGDDAAARTEYVNRVESSFLESPPASFVATPTPRERIDRARDEHARAVRRFVFTGRREETDPLRRHVAARRAETRSWLDVVAPIVWLPATIVRSVYAAVGHPVDDREILDAEAAFVRATGDGAERDEVLRDLADRYRRRDETWKAILALREAGADRDDLEPLEERLAERMMASEGVDPELRRVRLEWLVAALPPGELARAAQDELDAPRIAESGKSVPLTVALDACARVSPLPVESRLANGDERDGEIDPPRLRIEGMRARAEVRESGQRRELVIELDTAQAARLHALADEWEWRFSAARAETYPMRHSGIPVEIYAGFGASGLSVYPRLLPEGYERADRRLYE